MQWATFEALNFYTVAITPEPCIRHATGLPIENQILIQPHDPYKRFSIFGTLAYQHYHSFNAAHQPTRGSRSEHARNSASRIISILRWIPVQTI